MTGHDHGGRREGPRPGADGGAGPDAAPPGLYIHVPFCVRKCAYCDFASEAPPHPDRIHRYLACLDMEIGRLPADFRPGTVFLGGGTPTALDHASFGRLLDLVRSRAAAAVEWTCEANPRTVTRAKAGLLRAAGVTRVSLGAQSFDTATLSFLGRAHAADDIADAFSILRDAGVANLGVDVITAVPGRDRGALDRDMDRVLALAPQHVSAYTLSIEEGTPLAALVDLGAVKPVAEEQALAEYDLVRSRLGAAGFRHYEISNFALPGFECRHNLLYWSGGDYLGCGPAAHSHRNGARWGNVQALDAWSDVVSRGWTPVAFEERLAPEKRARETLVFSLRRLDGVDAAAFRTATGFDLDALCGAEIDRLAGQGLLERTSTGLRLAERALFISDTVFSELV
jgi:oxygen-independent coproporphyrinogen-3 oxidase